MSNPDITPALFFNWTNEDLINHRRFCVNAMNKYHDEKRETFNEHILNDVEIIAPPYLRYKTTVECINDILRSRGITEYVQYEEFLNSTKHIESNLSHVYRMKDSKVKS